MRAVLLLLASAREGDIMELKEIEKREREDRKGNGHNSFFVINKRKVIKTEKKQTRETKDKSKVKRLNMIYLFMKI